MIDVEAPERKFASSVVEERAPLPVSIEQELLRSREQVIAQVELFYELFGDRSECTLYEGSHGLDEVTQFVTRNDACTQIDEIYTVTDSYSPNLKTPQRSYVIDLFINQTHDKICIAGDQRMKVYRYDDEGQARLLNSEDTKDVLLDYELRALKTENSVTSRSEEEKRLADADAVEKLRDFHSYLERQMYHVSSPITALGKKALHDVYVHPEAWSAAAK